jgi:hypothetical protein
MNHILTGVSRVVHFNACHSKTHLPISGYTSSFYQGAPIPPSSQSMVLSYQIPSHSSFATPSSVQTFSYGCGYLPIAHQELLIHLSLLALSLSPEPHTVAATPALYPYPQSQAITNPGDLDVGFPSMAENSFLPVAGPTLTYEQVCGECKRMPRGTNLTRELTICDIVRPQFPSLDHSCFGPPAPDPTIVCCFILSRSVIPFHDLVGCYRT